MTCCEVETHLHSFIVPLTDPSRYLPATVRIGRYGLVRGTIKKSNCGMDLKVVLAMRQVNLYFVVDGHSPAGQRTSL